MARKTIVKVAALAIVALDMSTLARQLPKRPHVHVAKKNNSPAPSATIDESDTTF